MVIPYRTTMKKLNNIKNTNKKKNTHKKANNKTLKQNQTKCRLHAINNATSHTQLS